jgi:hypothetical protein
MYEEYIGKVVQVTTLKGGQKKSWGPAKVDTCSDGLLGFDNGEEIEVETIVEIRPEPPMPFEQGNKPGAS